MQYTLLLFLVWISVSASERQVFAQTVTAETPLDQVRRTNDPVEKQRILRTAIREDSANVEARILLGASHYKVGNLEAAMEQFGAVMALADTTDINYADAEFYSDEINRLFKPLRIRVVDRKISALGYIEGIRLLFRYPRSLTSEQKFRLEYLEDEGKRRRNEFQFSSIDVDKRPYLEIPYFPVVVSLDDVSYSKYSLVVGNRRYRYDFNEEKHDSVSVLWDENWQLVERVPTDLVKIEYPSIYTFAPADTSAHFTLVDPKSKKKGTYIPADKEVDLVLQESTYANKEKRYNRVIKGLVVVAGFIGLLGTR